MRRDRSARRLTGWLATALLALATTLWTFWGVGEMYYEGWWGAWTNRLPYLLISAGVTWDRGQYLCIAIR